MSRYTFFIKKKFILLLACILALLAFPCYTRAQSVIVNANIDSLQILIGEQAKIKLQVSFDSKQKVVFPHFGDTLVRGVEIVETAKADTQYLNNKQRLVVTQEYTITSFDSALYYLPPFQVAVGSKIYKSNPLALKVYSIPVDTLHPEQFFGQKGIMKPPFVWSDWKGLLLLSFISIPLLVLAIFLIIRYNDNKPIIRKIKIEPKLPPHQQAMKDIERIKTEKVWQKGRPKDYYTELTDALRTYIQDLFNFNAMEMTSSEIIDKLLEIKDKESLNNLKELFLTADLVKFAKHAPLMDENDMNLINAIEFINETKVEEPVDKKPQPTEITIEEKRSKRTKILLACGIIAISITIIYILVSIGSELYEFFI